MRQTPRTARSGCAVSAHCLVENIWRQGKPDGSEALKRLTALPGFGDQKARIFLALPGKQLGIKLAGVRPPMPTARRAPVAASPMSPGEVRAFKKAAKAAAKR